MMHHRTALVVAGGPVFLPEKFPRLQCGVHIFVLASRTGQGHEKDHGRIGRAGRIVEDSARSWFPGAGKRPILMLLRKKPVGIGFSPGQPVRMINALVLFTLIGQHQTAHVGVDGQQGLLAD